MAELNDIPQGAKKVATVQAQQNSNQKQFEKMIIIAYEYPGIGMVKMTGGIKRRTHEKIQYCITVMEV